MDVDIIGSEPGTVHLNDEKRVNIDLSPRSSGIRRRIENQLVCEGGWISFDIDASGFIVGIELNDGDTSECKIWDLIQKEDPREKS